jgi:hypothetical protein
MLTVVPARGVMGAVAPTIAYDDRFVTGYPVQVMMNVGVNAGKSWKRAAVAAGHDTAQDTVANHAATGITLEGQPWNCKDNRCAMEKHSGLNKKLKSVSVTDVSVDE